MIGLISFSGDNSDITLLRNWVSYRISWFRHILVRAVSVRDPCFSFKKLNHEYVIFACNWQRIWCSCQPLGASFNIQLAVPPLQRKRGGAKDPLSRSGDVQIIGSFRSREKKWKLRPRWFRPTAIALPYPTSHVSWKASENGWRAAYILIHGLWGIQYLLVVSQIIYLNLHLSTYLPI